MLLENEFQALLESLKKEARALNGQKIPSLSLTGSPLRKSKVLLLGSNWGGISESTPPQRVMPLANDILVSSSPTYSGYLKFFTDLFNNKGTALEFFHESVYTNGNLIRTPNEGGTHKATLNKFRDLSIKYLKEIIDVVEPKIIICFGNGENVATSALFKALYNIETFNQEKGVERAILTKNYNSYYFRKEEKIIFSFPHASRLGMWKGELSSNKIYAKLKKQLSEEFRN